MKQQQQSWCLHLVPIAFQHLDPNLSVSGFASTLVTERNSMIEI